jgi:hypothetical protein
MDTMAPVAFPKELPFSTPPRPSKSGVLFVCCINKISFENSQQEATINHSQLKLRGVTYNCASVGIGEFSVLKIPLDAVCNDSESIKLNLSDGGMFSENLDIPISDAGCRVTYFSFDSIGLTMCLVHELVLCPSTIDLFIEEQDFTYACMDIQEKLFLGHSRVLSISAPPPDELDLARELESMNAILSKYLPPDR